MTITSFAQLKRELKPGVKIVLVATSIPNHKKIGIIRAVAIQQTNAIKLEDGSWLGLGSTGEKAADYTFQTNGFTYDDSHRTKYPTILKYEFIEETK